MREDFYILIMAGGRGTRFWPKSTEEKPKQFLALISEKTMLQETYDRCRKILPEKNIFVGTGAKYIDLVKEQLPSLPVKNIVAEPTGRNTAPCILLASKYISDLKGPATVVVLPSDQLIVNEDKFIEDIGQSVNFMLMHKTGICTLGIEPNRPETGYGYIRTGEDVESGIRRVEKFVEKPDEETAKGYLASGRYLWNAGMFIFDTDYMISAFSKFQRRTHEVIMGLPNAASPDFMAKLAENYDKCENISVDYAILETSDEVFVHPIDVGWDDIGTWASILRYVKPDEDGNIKKGEVEVSEAKDCVVYGEKKRVILVDVEDLYVIEGENEIVVCKKESAGKIRDFRPE
ncbi:mannose-1-phosphate guanylyltransferase [Candidatus Saccharibacteria bacterium]|nr:mannose-1-phosphate guanylyltransferase [Candidatus Saccharibacteria bacterium]